MDRLVFTVIIGVLMVGTLVIAKPFEASTDTTCLTPGCFREASLVLQSMNRAIEPCDDFYEFACGGFEQSNTIPDDQTQVSVVSMLRDKVRKQLRSSIEEPINPGELRPFKIAKKLYKTCMNATATEETGLEPLHSILKELGGWPVLEGDDWRNDTFDYFKTVNKCFDLGYSPAFSTSTNDGEPKNSIKSVLQDVQFDLHEASLPRDYLIEGLKNKIVKAYFDYMVDIAVALGANEQRAADELKDSLEFETKLANGSWSTEVRAKLKLLNATMTSSQIELLYPYNYGYNTPKRSLANYVGWRVVQASIRYLTADLRAREIDYLTMFNGQRARLARWKECVDIVSESLPVSIGALYVRNHFNIDTKEEAKEMMEHIRVGLMEILEQAEWMDNGTRTRALEKVAAMGADIAFPEELRNDTKLEEYYAGLEPTADNLLATVLNLNVLKRKNLREYQRKSANETDWIRSSSTAVINAFYYPGNNNIEIPAGILQGSFFSSDRPRYMNYGAIGSVIGHEITHGFDNTGSQFDKDGSFVGWRNPETEEKFLKKTRCMLIQYENQTDKSVGLKLNGLKTLGENIADNGGLKETYHAYKKWVTENGPEPTLPGLDYTPEQMFWISAANTWCTRYRPEVLKLQIMQNEHSPARFRVIVPSLNNPEFSADFNCPLGSTMNPVDKCSVW